MNMTDDEESALEARKKLNSKIERKNNADLPAGSPMYFYCDKCGAEIALPENYLPPRPRICSDCARIGG